MISARLLPSVVKSARLSGLLLTPPILLLSFDDGGGIPRPLALMTLGALLALPQRPQFQRNPVQGVG